MDKMASHVTPPVAIGLVLTIASTVVLTLLSRNMYAVQLPTDTSSMGCAEGPGKGSSLDLEMLSGQLQPNKRNQKHVIVTVGRHLPPIDLDACGHTHTHTHARTRTHAHTHTTTTTIEPPLFLLALVSCVRVAGHRYTMLRDALESYLECVLVITHTFSYTPGRCGVHWIACGPAATKRRPFCNHSGALLLCNDCGLFLLCTY